MRKAIGMVGLAVVLAIGLGACNTPSTMDVERRMAAHAYRVEWGDTSAKPSEAQCTTDWDPATETDVTSFVVSTCTVRGYSYSLEANYNGPKGRKTSVDIRATQAPGVGFVARCRFTNRGTGWNVGSCSSGNPPSR